MSDSQIALSEVGISTDGSVIDLDKFADAVAS